MDLLFNFNNFLKYIDCEFSRANNYIDIIYDKI
jgi:hypothetical protein